MSYGTCGKCGHRTLKGSALCSKCREKTPEYLAARRAKWTGEDKVAKRARDRARDRRTERHGEHYGAWFIKMWEEQRQSCYLCGELITSQDEAFIDHDHSCPAHGPKRTCGYCRRGLTHRMCNAAIGVFGDDPALVAAVARNLLPRWQATRDRIATMPAQEQIGGM